MLLLSLALLAASPPAGAGVRFDQVTTVRVDGKEQGRSVASRVFASGHRLRLEPGDGEGAALLLHLTDGKAWRLFPDTRTVLVVNAAEMRAQAQMDASAAADAMGAPSEESVRVKDLGTSRSIAGRPCQDYRLRAPGVTLEVCLDAKAPAGFEVFAEFLEWTGAATALAPVLGAVRELGGFPLETHYKITALGHTWETVSTLTRVEFGPIPAALLEVPRDYTLASAPPEADLP